MNLKHSIVLRLPVKCQKITIFESFQKQYSVINSFEECMSAGNPVMESHPRQCRTIDGKHFVEKIDSSQ
ncbi:hypothetical protein NKOR_00890 [Candidatus Nitrosopumilus koreensis AR1]|uniref:Uncharacterized protein n=1 Tax=Candidatus Nitrosopumilus koreensis AR1 TaxID=1229908 RepID=K0B3P5_9ARCH|nr:hypothetical protein [Candidatus Nitrosopumilus koreensis]AFS80094.1 hypothetical protein NKOR_00890 [Candidatus Nitrosopumilus koreensis AR1]